MAERIRVYNKPKDDLFDRWLKLEHPVWSDDILDPPKGFYDYNDIRASKEMFAFAQAEFEKQIWQPRVEYINKISFGLNQSQIDSYAAAIETDAWHDLTRIPDGLPLAALTPYGKDEMATQVATQDIKAGKVATGLLTSEKFWKWVKESGYYDEAQVEQIRTDATKRRQVLDHYKNNILNSQWDIDNAAEYQVFQDNKGSLSFEDWNKAGRPKAWGRDNPGYYGLTDDQWQTLTDLSYNINRDEAVEDQLQKWISAGSNAAEYKTFQVEDQLQELISAGSIDQNQAAAIWDNIHAQFLYDSQARADASEATSFALAATGQKETPAERTSRLAERSRLAEQARLIKGYTEAPVPSAPRPFSDYGAGLEELRVGLSRTMPKTEQWRDWFRSKYPRLIERFEAKPEAERLTGKTWAEYLKKRKPEIREEFARLTPYQRGERPSAFAPRIQTVGF